MRLYRFAIMCWRAGCSLQETTSFWIYTVRARGMSSVTLHPSLAVISVRRLVSAVKAYRLRALAGQRRRAWRQLREHASLGLDVFLADPKTTNSAKYLLIVASEAALDICNHLAAKKGGRSPEDYAD